MTRRYHLMWRKAPTSRKAVRTLQKDMLCEVLSVSALPPVSYGAHGKPFIPSLPDFHYNFSDSGDFVMMGWMWEERVFFDKSFDGLVSIQAPEDMTSGNSRAGEIPAEVSPRLEGIGVDLQEIVPTHYDLERIAKRFYTLEEYTLLHSLPEPKQQEQAFFRLWAIKEAYLKYLGVGLAGGMHKYRIVPESSGTFEETGTLTHGMIVSDQNNVSASAYAYPCAYYEEIQPPEEGYTAAVVSALLLSAQSCCCEFEEQTSTKAKK